VNERIVPVNGVELCVEEFGPSTAPAVVLVPGAASAFDWWDDEFCLLLAAGGYRVVRYDLRDTGRSTTGPLGAPGYTGDDLVDDLAALILVLDLAPAHIVGVSFGGGIAQQIAISHPALVASLTLQSTSPGSDGLPSISPALAASFAHDEVPPDWTDRDSVFRTMLADEIRYGGEIPVDEDRIRRIADRIFDRSFDLSAGANHWSVTSARGRRDQLADITAPTLVVHGTRDPLFPIEHGEALAREIPSARLLRVPGLGHQFPPPETWDLLVPAILEHLGASSTPGHDRRSGDAPSVPPPT
jgi:pimeloyl-ACP methyl ester carboxylesterase